MVTMSEAGREIQSLRPTGFILTVVVLLKMSSPCKTTVQVSQGHTHTHRDTHMYTRSHTYIHRNTYAGTWTHTDTHNHTDAHTYTHVNTHTHKHTYSYTRTHMYI